MILVSGRKSKDLLENEMRRPGKSLSKYHMPMTFSHAQRLLNSAIQVSGRSDGLGVRLNGGLIMIHTILVAAKLNRRLLDAVQADLEEQRVESTMTLTDKEMYS
jgi:hypothetical protein